MHAIFVAHGPFASRLKTTSRFARRGGSGGAIPSDPATTVLPGFANTEVYELVAELLHVPVEGRARTNGTEGFWDEYLVPFDDREAA